MKTSISRVRLIRPRLAIRRMPVHSHAHDHSHDHSHAHEPHSGSKLEPPAPKPQSKDKIGLTTARQNCSSLFPASTTLEPNLVSPFIPSYARDAHTALFALQLILQNAVNPPGGTLSSFSKNAGTGDVTARIRLQFWKDTIQAIFAGKPVPSEPVVTLLSSVLQTHKFTRGFLLRMIDARIGRIGDPPFASIASIADFGESAYSSMLYLLSESMIEGRAVEVEHICSHIGRSMGVVESLADFPSALQIRSRVLLPLDMLIKYDLREEDILRRLDLKETTTKKKLADAVFEVATHANDQIITARTMYQEMISKQGGWKKIDDAVFAPVLTGVPVRVWLEKLEKVDFDIYNPTLRMRDWSLPWKMYWAYNSKKI
ncbi:Squalene/phytoene synthase-domain-containing protein [Lipomyces oligophaga]|uniref:Squalene/phytoene synthase-domain-containing protein n=1 Tax=Lipomyces oligophaga TaxID=45792 RepID=UPI0034D00F43